MIELIIFLLQLVGICAISVGLGIWYARNRAAIARRRTRRTR